MISEDALGSYLMDFLPVQRWFGAKDKTLESVDVEYVEPLTDSFPLLFQVVAAATLSDGTTDRYHVLVGCRPMGEVAEFLEGGSEFTIGELDTDLGSSYAYEASRDPELARRIWRIAAPHLEEPEHVRQVTTEQSNTSLIYDDRHILKIYRRLVEGPNPDVEIAEALWRKGFQSIPEPLGEWMLDDVHVGTVRRYLVGGTDGWAMALTSLRDLLGSGGAPSRAGGDFSAESSRLGEMTGQLHVALVEAFGFERGSASVWADAMEEQLDRVPLPEIDPQAALEVFRRLRQIEDPGPAIRVHGDFHLGQVMRTDEGWFVIDFEGEPARTPVERRRRSSPLKDVAGMLRSFQYAARTALATADRRAESQASAWEQRNRRAFLDGYLGIAHQGGLIPSDVASYETVLRAFELDKAIYEVGYEQSHRPQWVDIPLDAVGRLVKAVKT